MAASGLALLQVAITGLAAWFLGNRILARRWQLQHPGLQVAAQAGVGLLLLSYLLYALSMAGFLLPIPGLISRPLLLGVLGLLCVPAALALPDLRSAVSGLTQAARSDRWVAIGLGGAALYFIWMALCATLPPLSLDEYVYHLEVPRQILSVGYLPAFTDNVLAYYPMGPQMFFLFGLGIGGETAARLFHLLFGVFVVAALYGYARTLMPSRGAVLATAVFMTVPTLMVIGHWAYIDLNFTLYAFLALVSVIGYTQRRAQGERQALPYAVFAGLMAGAAWTVKYTSLQLVLLLTLLVLFEHLRGRPRQLPYGLVALGGIAFAMFLPYMLRTWWITGWPLFPFAIGPFELTEAVNWSQHQSDLALAWQRQYGAGYDRSLFERLMSSVWVFTSANDNYTAYDGVVGCAFLLAPLAFLVRKRPDETRLLATFGVMFLLYWSLTTTQVRFLVPGLPALALLLGLVATDRVPRLVTAALGFLIALNVLLGVQSVLPGQPGRLWTGRESRQEFMTRLRGPHALYMEANRRLRPGDRLYMVNMRTWGYLLDLPGRGEMTPFPNGWRSDYTFEYYNLEQALIAAGQPEDVTPFFADMGITHLMMDEAITLSDDALALRERRLFVSFLVRYGTLLVRNPRDPAQSLWRLNLGRPVDGGP